MAIIFLGPGNNTFVAATAGDTIYGEEGNDTLTASPGGNTLYGGDGDDTLNGGAGNDVLVGDVGTNFSYRNVLRGFGGDDGISSLSWFDQVNGGSGNDRVVSYAQTTGQVMDGGTGYDEISMQSLSGTNAPVNIIFGSTFVAVIGGINGATYMNFEVLKVTLGTGQNTIQGGAGDDVLLTAYLDGSNATNEFDAGFVKAGGGDDIVGFNGMVQLGTGIQRMSGGTGIDRLSWTSGASAITDLTINAQTGTMFALGRTFTTFSGFERVEIRTYDDLAGVFSYVGGDGVDSLYVGFTTGDIKGNGGDDLIFVTAGAATIDGGSGNDRITISYPNAARSLLDGGSGNDTLSGGSGKDEMFGGTGDDSLTAVNSHARIYGGADDDTMSFSFNNSTIGGGVAVIDGGSGRDGLTLQLLVTAGPYILNFSTATVTLAGIFIITGMEAVHCVGSTGNDDLTASNDALGQAANKLDGQFGNDTLRASSNGATLDGSFGLDRLIGAAGDDLLFGGFGAEGDILLGGGGSDGLFGGFGRDLLTGGSGADRFGLAAYFESGTTATTRDLLKDFSRTDGDMIDLMAVDAVQPVLGDQAFDFIGKAAFGNTAGELRYQQFNGPGTANDYTLISGDINGDAIVDFSIQVNGLIAFRADDFIL